MCGVVADDRSKFDEVVDTKGVKVIIDPRALMHLVGTTMDFVEDRLRSASLPSSFPSKQPLESLKVSTSYGPESTEVVVRGGLVGMVRLESVTRCPPTDAGIGLGLKGAPLGMGCAGRNLCL